MRHTTVADVMSTTVISARPQDRFAHLTTLLHEAAIRAVPVVDPGGTLLGVVSEADLMAAVARPDGNAAKRWWRPRHIASTPRSRCASPNASRAWSQSVTSSATAPTSGSPTPARCRCTDRAA